MSVGLDYSAGVIAPEAIVAAEYTTVFRYIDAPTMSTSAKHVTPAEYAALTTAGITVNLVFEIGTNDWVCGSSLGVTYAIRAQAGAQWVGYNGPIFFAVDTHLDARQIPTALAYLHGAQSVLGTIGVYGFEELIQAAQTARIGAAYWQCGHPPAPSSGVHVWQDNTRTVTVDGIECDVNHILIPIPNGGGDMTTEQQIADIHQQIMGPWAPWAGGLTDGANTPYTVVQLLLRHNVQAEQLNIQVQALAAQVQALQTTLDSLVPTVTLASDAKTGAHGRDT